MLEPAQQQLAGIGSSSSAGGKRLIAEVPPAGETAEQPAFALLANKRQQRQHQQQQPAAAAAAAALPGAAEAAGAAGTATQQQQAAPLEAAPYLQQHKLQAQMEYSGKPATAVIITLPLPAAAAVAVRRAPACARAAVSAETVRVQVPGCQPIEVQLPFAVSAAGGSAELAPAPGGKGGDSLVLTLPYRPFSSVVEELRQAAVAADGQGGSDLSELD